MKKILNRTIVLASVILLSLNACNQKSSSKSEEQDTPISIVRLGSFFTAVDYAPYLIAKNKGWFEDALKESGTKIEYTTFQSLPTLNEALATNKIDIIFEAEPPAIVGRAAGIDEKIVDISCSINLGILVPQDSKIASVRDLKGKSIALLAGTGVHYGVLKALEQNGLDKSDVKIVDMSPPDAKNAFETGKVDAWAIWSPFIDQEELTKRGRLLPNSAFQIQSIMVARNQFILKSPSVYLTVRKVFDKSQAWMEQNSIEAQSIVAKELGLSKDEVQKAWPRHNWKAQITPEIIQDIQNKANFLFEEKFIDKKVDVEKDLVQPSSQHK